MGSPFIIIRDLTKFNSFYSVGNFHFVFCFSFLSLYSVIVFRQHVLLLSFLAERVFSFKLFSFSIREIFWRKRVRVFVWNARFKYFTYVAHKFCLCLHRFNYFIFHSFPLWVSCRIFQLNIDYEILLNSLHLWTVKKFLVQWILYILYQWTIMGMPQILINTFDTIVSRGNILSK